ncbi:hypothetical protein [Acrocarpospora catenulata]|uniref:hypothetical protein n=1 Tax=Acrocarpospora catenulata TaxID=2836182 RepID=UPI001BDA14C4|nr:hypothetical protein [Acrocarpospora catenulata]
MNNFDFLVGTWDVHSRKLLRRGVGDDQWVEHPARMVNQSFFGGAGNFDEITFPTESYNGATVRLYDPKTDLWSLHWIDGRVGMDPIPCVGRFGDDGVGRFYADETWEGRPIRVRFVWSAITPTSCRWEQAFSWDDEATWEINWIMDFTRVN